MMRLFYFGEPCYVQHDLGNMLSFFISTTCEDDNSAWVMICGDIEVDDVVEVVDMSTLLPVLKEEYEALIRLRFDELWEEMWNTVFSVKLLDAARQSGRTPPSWNIGPNGEEYIPWDNILE